MFVFRYTNLLLKILIMIFRFYLHNFRFIFIILVIIFFIARILKQDFKILKQMLGGDYKRVKTISWIILIIFFLSVIMT